VSDLFAAGKLESADRRLHDVFDPTLELLPLNQQPLRELLRLVLTDALEPRDDLLRLALGPLDGGQRLTPNLVEELHRHTSNHIVKTRRKTPTTH